MAKCKCNSCPRISSNVVQRMCGKGCSDVCANPNYGEPNMLGIYAPIIYDEIGINLCTTVPMGVDISTTYPTATNASVRVLDATYTYGAGNVQLESLVGRPNCYSVTLSNITLQLAIDIYDDNCRLLGTRLTEAVYLPSDTTAPTYDEDTNPTSVALEIFAPYGTSYTAPGTPPTPVVNYIGFNENNNMPTQGLNLVAMAKALDLSIEDDTITVGVTLVLQSLYYVGYNVKSAGRIDIPKGSIIAPENTECMKFVAGELLDLAIKPLELDDIGSYGNSKNNCNENSCKDGASDETADIL